MVGKPNRRKASKMKTLRIFLGCSVAAAIFAAAQAQAVILTNDTFSDADGALTYVSGGAWVGFSGTTPINVTNGQAIITGANSQDAALTFGGTHTNDVLFY